MPLLTERISIGSSSNRSTRTPVANDEALRVVSELQDAPSFVFVGNVDLLYVVYHRPSIVDMLTTGPVNRSSFF